MAGQTKASYLMNIFEDRFLPSFSYQSSIRITHLALYLVLCLVIYNRFRKGQSDFSSTALRRFSWVKILVLSSLIIWGLYTWLYFYNQQWLNQIVPVVISASLYGLGYYGYKFPELFRNIQVKQLNSKYEFSRLSEDDKDLYSSTLVGLMKDEKLYANPDLKLQTLASRLDISPQNLSQIINERFHQNFSEFVNSFRVDEAKRLLVDVAHRHLTIVAIANEVGFNSKSAFNTAFKKFTKQTPSEYLESKTSFR
ncbi:MAG: helix-turn-helix domain-containing protein [Calditrichae bacterium]|nr:helix-turn-helix domain-containing protein [Calditrichia bacterium]